jgi:hypothetical protein
MNSIQSYANNTIECISFTLKSLKTPKKNLLALATSVSEFIKKIFKSSVNFCKILLSRTTDPLIVSAVNYDDANLVSFILKWNINQKHKCLALQNAVMRHQLEVIRVFKNDFQIAKILSIEYARQSDDSEFADFLNNL